MADSQNHCIRSCDYQTGAVTTLAGDIATPAAGHADGSGAAARFNFPGFLALGPDGALYVGDLFNHAIRRVTTNGQVTTVAGSMASVAPGADDDGAVKRLSYPTGLAFELPEGFRARVHSRSGLSLKHGIEAGAGLIDQGFRLPVGVLLYNHGGEDFQVRAGDRVAQLCIERYTHPTFVEVEAVEATARGAGWGSSGAS